MFRSTSISRRRVTRKHNEQTLLSGLRYNDNKLNLHLNSRFTKSFSTQTTKTNSPKPKVLIIAGPTGVGKTETGIKLAQKLDGEIICGDSVQLYKELNIGNWKISSNESNELEEVPHHLFDRLSVKSTEQYSAANYVQDARERINNILSRGKTPIVVGGSGFYQKSLIAGTSGGVQLTQETWNKVNKLLEEDNDWIKSLKRLEKLDPDHVPLIEFGDRYRLARAIGINLQTGKNMKEFALPSLNDIEFDYDFRTFFLYKSRLDLYRLVDVRCEDIAERGLFEETGEYLEHLTPLSTIGRAIGYAQAFKLITQHKAPITLGAFTNFLLDHKQSTRNLIRQQMLWFRRSPYYPFVNVDEIPVEKIMELTEMSPDHWHAFAETSHTHKQYVESAGIKAEVREYKPELGQFRSPKRVEEMLNRINAVRAQIEENGKLEKALAKLKQNETK